MKKGLFRFIFFTQVKLKYKSKVPIILALCFKQLFSTINDGFN